MLYPLGNNVGHVIGLNGHWIGRDVLEYVPFTAAGYYSGLLNQRVGYTSIRSAKLPLTLTGITGTVPSSYSGESGIFMPQSARELSVTSTYYLNQLNPYSSNSTTIYLCNDNLYSSKWWLPYSYMDKFYFFSATDGSTTAVLDGSGLPSDKTYYNMSVSTGGEYTARAVWNIPSSATTALKYVWQMPTVSSEIYVTSNIDYDNIYRWSATGLAPKG